MKKYFMTLINYTVKVTGITTINNSSNNRCNVDSCGKRSAIYNI